MRAARAGGCAPPVGRGAATHCSPRCRRAMLQYVGCAKRAVMCRSSRPTANERSAVPMAWATHNHARALRCARHNAVQPGDNTIGRGPALEMGAALESLGPVPASTWRGTTFARGRRRVWGLHPGPAHQVRARCANEERQHAWRSRSCDHPRAQRRSPRPGLGAGADRRAACL